MLQCPICASFIETETDTGLCRASGHRFSRANGIWRFLPLTREVEYQKFLQEYRTVREAEDWGGATAEYYRALPTVKRNDPNGDVWRIRARSFRKLLSWLDSGSLLVLDAGAGNGWLSYRLAQRGHRVAALDISDDKKDGLGARVNYDLDFECYQAEFDRLPFCPRQFDLVIFNAALHYSKALDRTLSEAKRVVKERGKIVVLDSPFYSKETSGRRAVETREADFAALFGFNRKVKNTGFLTPERVEGAANAAILSYRILNVQEPWTDALRRAWSERRDDRELARFPMIVLET